MPPYENGHVYSDEIHQEPNRHEESSLGFFEPPPLTIQIMSISSPTNTPSPSDPTPIPPRRGLINWITSLIKSFNNWIKNPANIPLFIWYISVAAGLIMLLLLMTGILNQAIPSRTRRKNWEEVTNQILNPLFVIMCLYQQPNLFYHLVLLCRWSPADSVEIKNVYLKHRSQRPHERAHVMFVVLLLNITCCSQYAMCGLYWGYNRESRPDWAVDLCIGVGIGAPVIAAIYIIKGPLKRNEFELMDQESQQHVVRLDQEPEWVRGLFDCCDDPRVAMCSFFCTFCVFGWNIERLGFGNKYVHTFTFILLCTAPFLVFGASALCIDDDVIAYVVGITGAMISVFGLLYGGFWRIEMREKFKLPGNRLCSGYPWLMDCINWLFCGPCSLAQEVRTANFYEVEDGQFKRKELGPLRIDSALIYPSSPNLDLSIQRVLVEK